MRFFRAVLLVSLVLCLCPLRGFSKETSIGFDVLGATASSADYDATGSFGLSAFADWRPERVIAFGVGGGFLRLNSWDLTAAWVDLGGRIYPLKPFSFGEAYLQGEAGVNPLKNRMNGWRGGYHAGLGAGVRLNLKGSHGLDLGLVYDWFSPEAQPLRCLGVKAGFVWTFGRAQEAASAAAPRLVRYASAGSSDQGDELLGAVAEPTAVPTPTVVPTATPSAGLPSEHVWVEGDNLRVLSKSLYGEKDLYPILVDANAPPLRRPTQLLPGVTLKIPPMPSASEKAAARVKSHQDGYKLWGKWGQKPQ